MLTSSNTPFIITIDGPSGVGKSTLAKMVAQTLDIAYLDTGAMYRTLALRLGPEAENLPEDVLRQRCAAFAFSLAQRAGKTVLSCNGTEVGDEIRNETVGAMASRLSARPAVRECLQESQRALGKTVSLVAEGRDMGSKVFPQAAFKFFLEASAGVRARRRYAELVAKGEAASVAEIAAQLEKRDHADRTRAVDPLRPAPDATIIDSSDMSKEEVLAAVLSRLGEQAGRGGHA